VRSSTKGCQLVNTITKAVQLLENRQPDQALNLLNNYMPQAQDDEKMMIVEIYMQWGFNEEAITILTNLLSKYPRENEIKIMLADLYIENNQDEQAMVLLNEIPEEDDTYIQSLLQLADLYQAQGLFEVAEQKLLTAKNLLPNEKIINFALGELYFSMGEYKKAITYYEKINTATIAEISIHNRLAEANALIGEYEQALNYYQQINVDDADTLFKYGFTAASAGRNDIAISSWETLIEKDPYYHSVFYELAKVYQEEKHPDKAYKIALQGLKNDEFNKKLYYLAGKLAHQLSKHEESDKWISEAIALDPDYKDAVLFKIESLKEVEDFLGIIKFIHDLHAMGLTDPLYDWELARAFYETESYNNALNHYNIAYNHFSKDADFLKEYGYFLFEEGRTNKGITVFETYLQLQPDDFEVEELMARFKQ